MANTKKDKDMQVVGMTTPTVIITPTIQTSNIHSDLSEDAPIPFEPHPGEYALVQLDKNGNEIPGSYISVGEKTYRISFEQNPNWLVKKKPVNL